MVKPNHSSFRRTLLSRLLLLSIPVLLVGEYVAYQEAKSRFLDSVYQNLTESAVRKGAAIRDLIDAYRFGLVAAGDAFSRQLDNPEMAQSFVQTMQQWLPPGAQCVQIVDLRTGEVRGSSCGDQPIAPTPSLQDLSSRPSIVDPRSRVQILPPPVSAINTSSSTLRQLPLFFQLPVDDAAGKPQAQLIVQAVIHRQEANQRGSLAGNTIVVDQNGVVLAHPNYEQIGKTIAQQPDAEKLQEIVGLALANKPTRPQILTLDDTGIEWLVGYSPVQIPASQGRSQTWTVLAATPMSSALYGLERIQTILVLLTLALVGAYALVAGYIARDLARPIEQLGHYALQIDQRRPGDRAPQTSKFRELNQLADALNTMVQRLDDRAEELETAWREAQVANEMKNDFLAITSHELRTPLNAIIGCIRLVRDDCCDSPEEELEFLQQADDAALHLLRVINDLLDISKIEAGKVELYLQPVSISDLCEQCLRMIQPAAEKKHLALSMHLDRTLAPTPLDEQRVRQMVINLLSNAVKFTPEGGHVSLSSKCGYGAQLVEENRPDQSPVNVDRSYLCLEVKDSGVGIPPDRWHLLFRPFQQIDSSRTRKHEGTGLGLALTKRLAELHGGTMSFQSVPGQGSTFCIWLPLPDALHCSTTAAATDHSRESGQVT